MPGDAGNLCFPVPPEFIEKAENVVSCVHNGEEMTSALGRIGALFNPPAFTPGGSKLMVIYSDFNLDDLLGIAQLWQLKKEMEDLQNEPLFIWHVCFDGQDQNTVFEKKNLVQALLLGRVQTYILTHEGDQGGAAEHPEDQDVIHPHATKFISEREQTLSEIGQRLSSFDGDHIDLYLLSPGRGNLADIVAHVHKAGWPSKAKWKITMYSGSYNVRWMHERDFRALQDIMNHSDDPLVDISNFVLFGRNCKHPWTENMANFATEDFAANLAERAPFLAASFKVFHDEFLHVVVDPSQKTFFQDSLTEEEQLRFHDFEDIHDSGIMALQEFAARVVKDKDIFEKVRDNKRVILKILAAGGCAIPLCDNLPFLYEWLRHKRPQWLEDAEPGWWQCDKKTGFTTIAQNSCSVVALKAIQPQLRAPTDEAQLLEMRTTLEAYLWKHLDTLSLLSPSKCPRVPPSPRRPALHRERSVINEWDSGNLIYPVTSLHLAQADDIVQRTRKGEHLESILGGDSSHPRFDAGDKPLMVVYTDLEPDDTMAIAQLWQWKRDNHDMSCQPLLIWHVDFDNKERGMVFEKKELIAALMLSHAKFHILLGADDRGGKDEHHPRFDELHDSRSSTVQAIADTLASFKGERIDFYIIAPGHGNIGAIVAELKEREAWPLKASWQVFLYSGAFNMRGMYESDFSALADIMKFSDMPLVDLSKFPFFGGGDTHRWATSLNTFVTKTFAEELTRKYPLLAAALKIFNDEFNASLVTPKKEKLFRGKELTEEERKRWKAIKRIHANGNLQEYAQALVSDTDLFAKVAGFKKSTIRAFAGAACDSPLCDQLCFLYEWLLREHPQCLRALTPGQWHFDKESGHTSIRNDSDGGIKAIQPVLRDPKDESSLMLMRNILESNLLKYLSTNAWRAEIQTKISGLCDERATVLTKQEFQCLIEQLGTEASPEKTDMIMAHIGDKDGQIDLKAFLNWAFL